MLTLILGIALIWAIWKITVLGFRLTWGMLKFVFGVILFPLIVIGIFAAGLVYIALPIVIIAGLVALFTGKTSAT